MNKILEDLSLWECDLKGALERFMDDEELYLSCLKTVAADETIEKLGVALREENVEQAFDDAHMLKGVIGNMGLTPIYNIVIEIVEPLRKGKTAGLMPVYERLLESIEKLKTIIG